jgi:hypothetical protein
MITVSGTVTGSDVHPENKLPRKEPTGLDPFITALTRPEGKHLLAVITFGSSDWWIPWKNQPSLYGGESFILWVRRPSD